MEDLRSIRATTSMLGITEENHFVMVDTSWENIEYEFTRLNGMILGIIIPFSVLGVRIISFYKFT